MKAEAPQNERPGRGRGQPDNDSSRPRKLLIGDKNDKGSPPIEEIKNIERLGYSPRPILNISEKGPKEYEPNVPVEMDDIRIIDDVNRRKIQLIKAQADEHRIGHPEEQPVSKADDLS